jgi:hypothetical protein
LLLDARYVWYVRAELYLGRIVSVHKLGWGGVGIVRWLYRKDGKERSPILPLEVTMDVVNQHIRQDVTGVPWQQKAKRVFALPAVCPRVPLAVAILYIYPNIKTPSLLGGNNMPTPVCSWFVILTYVPLAKIGSSIPAVTKLMGECTLAWWHGVVMAGYALVGIQTG